MKKAVRAIVFKDNQLLVIQRNKFGKKYCTLPGGGVEMGETIDQALRREMAEETGLQLGNARLVFTEAAGEPYGTQYVYLVDYAGGEPALAPDSDEASINALGQNIYQPAWLPLDQLPAAPFVSERLKQAILRGIKAGFPAGTEVL
ncbi:MAG TPA: NUDIX hydrolase [Candidatus Saccharimonadales bacterium]|nr:NUDIX hydrolase [Candidatus Saccharimonadales bacterium]